MKIYKKMYVLDLLLLLTILLLTSCLYEYPVYSTTSRKDKGIIIWDLYGIKSIAIALPTTMPSLNNTYKMEDSEYRKFDTILYSYVGTEAKKAIQETDKYTVVTDRKDADAILDCDIISIHREREVSSGKGYSVSGYKYIVIYNIIIKRTSDGTIIDDTAGIGDVIVWDANSMYGMFPGFIKEQHLKRLINVDFRQLLGMDPRR